MGIRTLALITLSLPAACVSQGPQSQLGSQERALERQRIELARTNDCVFQSTIDGFDALDDRHVVLFSGTRRAYLAELAGTCFDLDGQVSLVAVDGDGNGQVCGYGRDAIAFRRLGRVENCRITGIERLSDERRLELGLAEPAERRRGEDASAEDDAGAEPK